MNGYCLYLESLTCVFLGMMFASSKWCFVHTSTCKSSWFVIIDVAFWPLFSLVAYQKSCAIYILRAPACREGSKVWPFTIYYSSPNCSSGLCKNAANCLPSSFDQPTTVQAPWVRYRCSSPAIDLVKEIYCCFHVGYEVIVWVLGELIVLLEKQPLWNEHMFDVNMGYVSSLCWCTAQYDEILNTALIETRSESANILL